ncbi:subtilisin-like protein [Dissoconium aciculare CBS 342.82]|uniref:Subtilisin-like protein n=1 Tax=Dissoconium aciculare CBS 342.82 TaxID=1314786 RepID=A0A6J3M0R8_9PEZI|nr:subtilisin-like protein [Dissoconium aciculare CBS 342.82]KAF1821089.1 subtilisin-like protein [Dissoconium aciculare CBS 342.82]
MAKFILSFFALAAICVNPIYAVPDGDVQAHQSGGAEHIVIIDSAHPAPPAVAEVLNRLALDPNHPDVKWIYNNSAFTGFSASMGSHCLGLLANMSDVSTVEKAMTVSSALVMPRQAPQYFSRASAPWGLQSLASPVQPPRGSSISAELGYTYSYTDTSLGAGSDVYILDTGIYTQHNIFGGRAKMAWSFQGDNVADNDGHGTHVAGTAAGSILGIASNANIWGIKGLAGDGSGWSSNVIAGIDFVLKQHEARRGGPDFVGSVLSMSLSSGTVVAAIDSAVAACVNAGIHVCVAAGNEGVDACSASPASSGGANGRGAITVGAVDVNLKHADFSNYGSCVDVYAPGVDVVSSWIGAPNVINVLSGTSMATPHVSGVVAYLMARNPELAASPALMKKWILDNARPLADGTLLLTNGAPAAAAASSGKKVRDARPDFVFADEDHNSSGFLHRAFTKLDVSQLWS